jgi:hypothetical protein
MKLLQGMRRAGRVEPPLLLEGPAGTGFYIARSPNSESNVPAFWCKRCSLSVTFAHGTVPPLKIEHCAHVIAEYHGDLAKLPEFSWREIALHGAASRMDFWDSNNSEANYSQSDPSAISRQEPGELFRWEGEPPGRGFI